MSEIVCCFDHGLFEFFNCVSVSELELIELCSSSILECGSILVILCNLCSSLLSQLSVSSILGSLSSGHSNSGIVLSSLSSCLDSINSWKFLHDWISFHFSQADQIPGIVYCSSVIWWFCCCQILLLLSQCSLQCSDFSIHNINICLSNLYICGGNVEFILGFCQISESSVPCFIISCSDSSI